MNESYIQGKMRLLQLDRFYENTLHMVDVNAKMDLSHFG